MFAEADLGYQNLTILPVLLQTAVLTLLSASIPLAMTLASVLLALTSNGGSKRILRNPTFGEILSADSLHVLAFTSHGDLLVAESEGSFDVVDWEEIYEVGERACCDKIEQGRVLRSKAYFTRNGTSKHLLTPKSSAADDDTMQAEALDEKVGRFVKSVLKEKVETELQWKD
jgi:exosome complex component RRP46